MTRAVDIEGRGVRVNGRSVGVGAGSAIPDSVVSREDDNSLTSKTAKHGHIINTKSEWPSIGARISKQTSGVTRAYLHNYDEANDQIGSLIQDVDISSLTSNDSFTFDDVNLPANNKYMILVDAEGQSFTLGFNLASNYPYTSQDVDITARWDGTNTSSDQANVICVNDIGNTGF